MPKKQLLEQVVAAPSIALENTLRVSEDLVKQVGSETPVRKAREYWHLLGPGLTTGAADDDPSGITTYSQAGAQYGLQLLWLAGFTFPLMAVIQEMCARLGMVTGRGLAANIRAHFPRSVLYTCTILLLIANTFNIGADLGAMAKATQLLAPNLPFGFLLLAFAGVSLLLQIFTTYDSFARYLKYLALILLAYIFTAFNIPNFDWQAVLYATVHPTLTFTRDQILLVCAILGTTISPYLFFWQTSQEVEEEVLAGKTTLEERRGHITRGQLRDMRIDIWSGMFLSNIVMFFIIAVCAATLAQTGITTITTAADAAAALEPLAGSNATVLFALGIIGTGLLAIPVLAGSIAYAFSESFGWKNGLYRKLRHAYAFYGIIIIATGIGFGLNFIGLDPIKALVYSAVANGLIAPVILCCILLLANNAKIMGDHKNGFLANTFGWLITSLMIAAGVATIVTFVV